MMPMLWTAVQTWGSTLGLFLDLIGFVVITASAFLVQYGERRAREADTKSAAYVHMDEQMVTNSHRERHALQSRSEDKTDDVQALDKRLKAQGDWYREQRNQYRSEASQVRALGFKMEGRALAWGAGLIILGTALQLASGWPR